MLWRPPRNRPRRRARRRAGPGLGVAAGRGAGRNISPVCSAPINRFVGGPIARRGKPCAEPPTETVTLRHRTTGVVIDLQLCTAHAEALRRRKRAVEVVPSPILAM
jgi:hypothetical protein